MKVYCPSCGSPVAFRYDDSFVRICDSCHSALVRTDRGIETFGQFADLTPTQSGLALGDTGALSGTRFVLTGRCEYRHPAGGSWEEWYMKLADGRWGWLAQAQGDWVVTFPSAQERQLPAFDELAPGMTLELGLGAAAPLTIGECNVSTLAGAEGEIPFQLTPGEQARFADLSDARGRFATLDYGGVDSNAAPSVFVGRRMSLAELGLKLAPATAAPEAVARSAERLACPNCGGSVELRLPGQSQVVACAYCGALLDCVGPLAILERPGLLESAPPPFPLGTQALFFGVQYTAIGRLRREASYLGGIRVEWEEFLLHSGTAGYRWLVHVKGHWSFVAPLPAGAVSVTSGAKASYGGKRFALYDSAQARVNAVWGEFYWRVSVGEAVNTREFISPPAMLSEESSQTEINWSLGLYQSPRDMGRALGRETFPDRRQGVGGNQPFLHRHLGRISAVLGMAFLVLTLVRGGLAGERRVYSERLMPTSASQVTDPAEQDRATIAAGYATHVFFTSPFRLTGGKPARVQLWMPVDNTWGYATVDLIDEASGEFVTFGKEISYYHGVEGGESWSEGSQSADHVVLAKHTGSHLLRVEVQTPPGSHQPVLVQVEDDVFVWGQFVWFLAALSLPALAFGIYQWSFEHQRWSESDYAPAMYTVNTESDSDD